MYLNPIIYNSRPADFDQRLEKEQRCYEFLEQLQIPYERVDHEATATVESCQEVEKLLQIDICKNLFLCNSQKTKFYLLMMPGNKKFLTKILSKQIGSARLSFAKPEYMEQYLDITPGSVSVLGLMNDVEHHVQLIIDEDLLKHEYIGCHPCINTSSLKLSMRDIIEKLLPAMEHEPIYVNL
ncbi:MAG: prolyl-tRNA synthetase associated domain-containing protein [Lachnospiraceae bacterium]|nr:prolyl-tRNA synthetase associated domain-containing protein [Lachnospiraceae bacterium]